MFPAAAGAGLAVGRGPHLVAVDRVVGADLIWSLLAEIGQLFEPNGASSGRAACKTGLRVSEI